MLRFMFHGGVKGIGGNKMLFVIPMHTQHLEILKEAWRETILCAEGELVEL